jgi:antitoxin MazE
MKTRIRRIGNSTGIILSKSILNECKMTESDEVNLTVVNGKIMMEKIAKQPRQDWEQQLIKANALNEKEMLIDDHLENNFDQEEWTW